MWVIVNVAANVVTMFFIGVALYTDRMSPWLVYALISVLIALAALAYGLWAWLIVPEQV